MSFARGLALAAMAATAMSTQFGAAANEVQNIIRESGLGFGPDGLPGPTPFRYGRSHYAGHRGQFAKAVDRRRMRNRMRRVTRQQQRRAA